MSCGFLRYKNCLWLLSFTTANLRHYLLLAVFDKKDYGGIEPFY